MKQYDVIVAYSAPTAASPADATYNEATPFSATGVYFRCNPSYEYFLQYCAEQGIQAALVSTTDSEGNGRFSASWEYSSASPSGWERKLAPCRSAYIFERCAANRLNLDASVKTFQAPHIRTLFDDKLITYRDLSAYAIPTVELESLQPEAVASATQELTAILAEHARSTDFTSTFIIKDRKGSSGRHIIKIDSNELSIASKQPSLKALPSRLTYVLQPFIETDQAEILGHTGRVDIRAIVADGVIVQSFMRQAQPGEYRTNAYVGGELFYIDVNDIPAEVQTLVHNILATFSHNNAVFALDFIKSNGGNYYLVEGNSMPGLNWFMPENAKHAKKLIRTMIDLIKRDILST